MPTAMAMVVRYRTDSLEPDRWPTPMFAAERCSADLLTPIGLIGIGRGAASVRIVWMDATPSPLSPSRLHTAHGQSML
jgi:hypothetical protein